MPSIGVNAGGKTLAGAARFTVELDVELAHGLMQFPHLPTGLQNLEHRPLSEPVY